jgi:pyrroline-5-carboxylate reductase
VIAILGTGKMGEALLSGLLRAGRPPSAVVAAVRREDRGAELHARYGVQASDAASAAKMADTLVLAVKPQDMAGLLDEIAPVVPPDKLVISVAAGITTAFIGRRLAGDVPVIRVMSNTPVLVDEAMSVISAGAYAGEEHLRLAEELLRPVGKVLRIPESQQDAATALSGSGPAYVYYLVESMVDAAILLGMARGAALEIVTQAVYGAATMLRESGEHPVILREAVTSPGGTTISAIRELEKHGVRAAFLAAIEAARDRGRELGVDSDGVDLQDPAAVVIMNRHRPLFTGADHPPLIWPRSNWPSGRPACSVSGNVPLAPGDAGRSQAKEVLRKMQLSGSERRFRRHRGDHSVQTVTTMRLCTGLLFSVRDLPWRRT